LQTVKEQRGVDQRREEPRSSESFGKFDWRPTDLKKGNRGKGTFKSHLSMLRCGKRVWKAFTGVPHAKKKGGGVLMEKK